MANIYQMPAIDESIHALFLSLTATLLDISIGPCQQSLLEVFQVFFIYGYLWRKIL